MLNIHKFEALIKEKGWSNTFFADMFGRSKTWISDMKRGKGIPDGNVLEQIADKLDTTVDYLTDKTDEKNKPTTKTGDELVYVDPLDAEMHSLLLQLTPAEREMMRAQIRGIISSRSDK